MRRSKAAQQPLSPTTARGGGGLRGARSARAAPGGEGDLRRGAQRQGKREKSFLVRARGGRSETATPSLAARRTARGAPRAGTRAPGGEGKTAPETRPAVLRRRRSPRRSRPRRRPPRSAPTRPFWPPQGTGKARRGGRARRVRGVGVAGAAAGPPAFLREPPLAASFFYAPEMVAPGKGSGKNSSSVRESFSGRTQLSGAAASAARAPEDAVVARGGAPPPPPPHSFRFFRGSRRG